MAAVAAAALAGGTLLGIAPSAAAATVSVSGASFDWGIHDYIQYGGTGASCNFMAAGAFDGTNATTSAATYATSAGNVALLRGGVPATNNYADRCAGYSNFVSGSSNPGGPPANLKARWTGGTGTRDTVTGATTLNFVGALVLKYSGAPIRITDPVLTVSAAGVGELRGTVAVGNTVAAPAYTTPNVLIASMSGVTTSATGFTSTPSFFGNSVSALAAVVPATTPPTSIIQPVPIIQAQTYLGSPGGTPAWGAWPAAWISALQNNGAASGDGGRFWSSSIGATETTGDRTKAPSGITVSYTHASDTAPNPGSPAQNVAVTVQQITDPAFSWTIPDNNTVNLTGGTLAPGDYYDYNGDLNDVRVTDTRLAGTWQVNGQVGDFITSGSETFEGFHLGWTPSVSVPGANAVAGSTIAPGTAAGQGLAVSRSLASGAFGGTPTTGDLDADLLLRIPGSVEEGDYSATLTITALAT